MSDSQLFWLWIGFGPLSIVAAAVILMFMKRVTDEHKEAVRQARELMSPCPVCGHVWEIPGKEER